MSVILTCIVLYFCVFTGKMTEDMTVNYTIDSYELITKIAVTLSLE